MLDYRLGGMAVNDEAIPSTNIAQKIKFTLISQKLIPYPSPMLLPTSLTLQPSHLVLRENFCQRRRKNVPDGGVKVYQSG
jgi:hypothetical protein